MSGQPEFPYDRWDALKALAESDGVDAVIAYVEGHADLLERRKLYLFALSAFAQNDWEGKNLDTLIAIGGAGIREGLREAADEADAEVAARRVDFANVLSYSLAAALADCWEGDDAPRERRHFEAGVRAAEDCVRWRDELGKGPGPKSMATWALGMHRLSLGDLTGSRESFSTSLEQARAAAADGPAGDSDRQDTAVAELAEETEVAAHEDFGIALAEGYLGLVEDLLGGGDDRYQAACASFRRMTEDDAKRDDAEFGLEQLAEVRRRYPSSGAAPASGG